jgi:predicted house-cleaning noncanonical NTP pyrophosphatase (MazG superfamily)
LKDKLVEEASELRDAEDIMEELADVQEVLEALIEAYGLDRGAVELARADKKANRGGFSQGLYLIR